MVAALRAVVEGPLPGAGCDVEEARRFLGRLDPAATVFTFATFTDEKPKPRPDALAGIRTGTLDQLAPWLERHNAMGAGVFVTVNETNGEGRKKENIVGLRALWQEADRGDEPQLPVEPHMVVESSPGKFHRYVLVRDGVLDEFESVQKRLVDDYGSDPNAADLSRVLRLPGFYHMKNPDSPHLVRLIEVSEAPPLLWDDAKVHFPPVERNPKAGSGSGFNRASSGGAPSDAGIPLMNPAKVASALEHLDPDMAYMNWLKVGMALHATGGSTTALELWDRWSAPGLLYKEDECAYRWTTFHAEREAAVSIATLFWMAREAGWDDGYGASEFVLHYVPIERELALAEFNRCHGMAMIEGKDVIVYRERDEAFGGFVTRLADLTSIKNFNLERQVPVLGRVRNRDVVQMKKLVDVWLQWSKRRKYKQVVFRPEAGLVAGDLGLPDEEVLNLYQGLAVQPKQGDCSRMLSHIHEVICAGNPELYTYVMSWLARMFQEPDKPGETALVLQSGQGTGKNFFINPLVRAFGGHGMVLTRLEDLTGRFNDHLATSVLVFANEALWGGNKDQEGALKALSTDEGMLADRKWVPKRRVRNHVHVIVASNNEWAVPIDLDDRRFVVLEVSETRKGDFAYFGALNDEIQNGGTEALIHHLLHLDISGFNPRELPKTGPQEAKLLAKIRGLDSVGQWWFECVESGQITMDLVPGSTFEVEGTDAWEERPITVTVDRLYHSYVDSTRSSRRHVSSKNEFGKQLRKLVGDGFSKTRTEMKSAASNGKTLRPWAYVLPSLPQCREVLEERMGQPGPWHDEDADAGTAF